jgi:hypothetical protein
MSKTPMSLCILTHNRIDETVKLIESITAFPGIDFEISIADQQSDPECRQCFQDMADCFSEVSDRELWEYGFGAAKQVAVDATTNDWIIYGDPGEVWHENRRAWVDGLAVALDRIHGNTPALRVMRGDPREIRAAIAGMEKEFSDDNGRIFRKSQMKMMGYIHEAPMHKATGELWAFWARRFPPVALVEHAGPNADDKVFAERKRILYWHLIHKIVTNPHLRIGTDFHWWTTYWMNEVEPYFKEVSFEEWQKIGG